MKCAVFNCTNNCKNKSLRFHSIPRKEDLRKQWLRFCGQGVDKNGKVCSEHFRPEDYDRSLRVEMGFAKYDALKKGVVPTVNKNPVPIMIVPAVPKNLVSTTTATARKVVQSQKVQTFILPLSANKITDDQKQVKLRPILPAPVKKVTEAEQQHKISTTSNLVISSVRSFAPSNLGSANQKAEAENQHKISTTAKNLVISTSRSCVSSDLGCTINYLENKIETLKSDAEANTKMLELKIDALKTENSRLQTCSKIHLEYSTEMEKKIDTLRREKFILELAETKLKKEKAALEMRIKKVEFEQRNLEQKLGTIFTPGQIRKIKIGNKVQHWSEEDISQSFKLYATSAKMYLMLRERNYPIPGVRTLQHWGRKRKINIEPNEDVTCESTIKRSKKSYKKKETVCAQNDEATPNSNFVNGTTISIEMIKNNPGEGSPNSYVDEENLAIEMLDDDADDGMEMITTDGEENNSELDETTAYNAEEDDSDIEITKNSNDLDEESTISAVEDEKNFLTITKAKDLDEESTISAVENEQDLTYITNSNASDDSNPICVQQVDKPWLEMQEFIIPCAYVPDEDEE